MKKALVTGAGGFIGGHLVTKLKEEGYWVRGVDLKYNEFKKTDADDFVIGDLRKESICKLITEDIQFDEVYSLAADMGGAGFVFTGDNDANIMHNSAMINLNMLEQVRKTNIKKIFYSSSACIYPEYNQMSPETTGLPEDCAYPAAPDSEYGWEKLFSERLYLAYQRNYNIDIRIARFHNIFGPLGTWEGGREKAPAAFCRKIAKIEDNGEIEMWGDGEQTRSFLYIDNCIKGVLKLMDSKFIGPVNIGSEERVSINQLANMVAKIANKKINIKHIDGPLGVRGRNSDNKLIKEKLGWAPDYDLYKGLIQTYSWIKKQVANKIKT